MRITQEQYQKFLQLHMRIFPDADLSGKGILAKHTIISSNVICKNLSLGMYSGCSINSYLEGFSIGNYSSIGHWVTSVHAHPLDRLTTSVITYKPFCGASFPGMTPYKDNILPITVGSDVLIGANVCIKGGITISDGAVIGAGAVVTRNVPPFAIIAGNPARILRYRFTESVIERILSLRWFDYDWDGMEIYWKNPVKTLDMMEKSIANGHSRIKQWYSYTATEDTITVDVL